jgi:predicted RNA binding protein YcfA (HicA-like mRNA interferase family)
MAKLPTVSSRKVVKAFRSFGWEVARQESSHIIMLKEGEIATLSVPDHNSGSERHLAELDSFGRLDGGGVCYGRTIES